jgi:hypothetical protein
MRIFPITSINNFFKDPDKVVKYANTLEYKKTPEGYYPGKRTDNLADINYDFFHKTILSILLPYFHDMREIGYSDTVLCFHKIKPYSKSFTDVRNHGWIHHDGVALGGLIYLNKNSYPESGTSLYTPKKEPLKHKKAIETKISFYKDGKINLKQYKKEMTTLEKKFIKTHTINNTYNTMVAFDGFQWHKVNNLYAHPKEDRLALVFFIGKIQAANYPKLRLDKLQSLDI